MIINSPKTSFGGSLFNSKIKTLLFFPKLEAFRRIFQKRRRRSLWRYLVAIWKTI